MRKMKVFHISRKDLGSIVRLEPRIPEFHADGEDRVIPRICVAPTILGCIRALELPSSIVGEEAFFDVNKDGKPYPLYLYSSKVNVLDLRQPTNEEVQDYYNTGELWITAPWWFNKIADLTIRKHMDLPNCAYSRYCITEVGKDEVCDKVAAPEVYGDDSLNFSFIAHNLCRDAEAMKYAEENRLYY